MRLDEIDTRKNSNVVRTKVCAKQWILNLSSLPIICVFTS